jgi:hypothetical protein
MTMAGYVQPRIAAFAAGGLLAMLTNSLMPYAYERGGVYAGFWAVVGYALAILPRPVMIPAAECEAPGFDDPVWQAGRPSYYVPSLWR